MSGWLIIGGVSLAFAAIFLINAMRHGARFERCRGAGCTAERNHP